MSTDAERNFFCKPMAGEPTAREMALREALELIAAFGQENLAGEWEHGLRDIIRSMTDCARKALDQ